MLVLVLGSSQVKAKRSYGSGCRGIVKRVSVRSGMVKSQRGESESVRVRQHPVHRKDCCVNNPEVLGKAV